MRRLRGALLLFGILVFIVPGAAAGEVLTNDAIVTMVKGGLGEDLIVSKIKISRGQYDLSTAALLRLKTDGVSEPIIKAMLDVSTQPESLDTKSGQAAAPPPAGAQGVQEQAAVALYRQGKTVEAAAAFDSLIAGNPNDDGLKIWKALALLEQARAMKDANTAGYKPLVVSAYSILQPLGRRIPTNPDWNFAMAKAFWLNDRPTWGRRAAEKALELRGNFAEAQLLLGELAYDQALASPILDPRDDPTGEKARMRSASAPRKAYENVLGFPDLSSSLRAEALFKLGLVSADLENKKETARGYWERAVGADADSRYGRMAQEKLNTVWAK